MYPLNRISLTLSIPTLALAGLITAGANFAIASGSLPPVEAPTERVWMPSDSPAAVAAEMREVVRSETRERMMAALRPDSLVWNGALDGQKLAEEMRNEVTAQIPGEMILGMQAAMGQIRIDPRAQERTEKVEAPALEDPQRVVAWAFTQERLARPILP
jgi:hypothetical protein